MLRALLYVFTCTIVTVSCYSCKEKKPPVPAAEQAPAQVSEYEQIPAIQNLTNEIEKNTGNAELYYKRAVTYLELGNQQYAVADLSKAIQLDSSKAGYYQLLGRLYFDGKQVTRAIDILKQGNRSVPGDTSLMLQLADYNLRVGDLAASIKLSDEVLKKNFSNAKAYFLKGMIFKDFGDTAKSISNFQTAVEQEPRYYEAYLQLGLLFSKKKNKLALDYFNNALKLDSSKFEVKYAIARYYQETGDDKTALDHYRSLILDYPQDAQAYYNTGVIYYQMDSFATAKRNFERALALEPANPNVYYALGECAKGIKDFKTAKYYYQQALNLDPKHNLAKDALQQMQ